MAKKAKKEEAPVVENEIVEIDGQEVAVDPEGFPHSVGDLELMNSEKVRRALDGTTNAKGIITGGVRKADGTFDTAALLAEYDRIGGLIMRNGSKVKTGCFFDFGPAKTPFKKPVVVTIHNINGQWVEVADGDPEPDIVKAAKILEKAKK